MAQKAFVFVIKKEEEEGSNDFPENSVGAGRESGALCPPGQLSCNHRSAWSSLSHPPQPPGSEEHPSTSPSPPTAQTISQSCLDLLALPLEAIATASSASLRSLVGGCEAGGSLRSAPMGPFLFWVRDPAVSPPYR